MWFKLIKPEKTSIPHKVYHTSISQSSQTQSSHLQSSLLRRYSPVNSWFILPHQSGQDY